MGNGVTRRAVLGWAVLPPSPQSVYWNPWNKVVQCHRYGDVDQRRTDRARALRGLPVPWTPEVADRECLEAPVY
jgi:hypothetical protein